MNHEQQEKALEHFAAKLKDLPPDQQFQWQSEHPSGRVPALLPESMGDQVAEWKADEVNGWWRYYLHLRLTRDRAHKEDTLHSSYYEDADGQLTSKGVKLMKEMQSEVEFFTHSKQDEKGQTWVNGNSIYAFIEFLKRVCMFPMAKEHEKILMLYQRMVNQPTRVV